MNNKEIEVRFLDIDKEAMIQKLLALGAVDHGEVMLEEVIIYNKDLTWREEQKFIRVRKSGDSVKLTYKQHALGTGVAHEIEQKVSDLEKAVQLFEAIGFVAYRRQQKKRHTLKAFGVTFDIDSWPKIPPYIEIEGDSLAALKSAADKLGFDWSHANMQDARWVIENVYKIPVGTMRWFTFDRVE